VVFLRRVRRSRSTRAGERNDPLLTAALGATALPERNCALAHEREPLPPARPTHSRAAPLARTLRRNVAIAHGSFPARPATSPLERRYFLIARRSCAHAISGARAATGFRSTFRDDDPLVSDADNAALASWCGTQRGI
jgi:hypothetical protein